MSCFQVRTSWISLTYSIQWDLQHPHPLPKQTRCQFKPGFLLADFRNGISSFLEEWSPSCGWRNQALCSFNSGKLGCRVYFTTTLSARGNAAVRSCDKCLLVLTGTAQPVPRFLFKCPFPDIERGWNWTALQYSTAVPLLPALCSTSCAVSRLCSTLGAPQGLGAAPVRDLPRGERGAAIWACRNWLIDRDLGGANTAASLWNSSGNPFPIFSPPCNIQASAQVSQQQAIL